MLERYMGPIEHDVKNNVQDVKEKEVIDLEAIDLDAELGLKKTEQQEQEEKGEPEPATVPPEQ